MKTFLLSSVILLSSFSFAGNLSTKKAANVEVWEVDCGQLGISAYHMVIAQGGSHNEAYAEGYITMRACQRARAF